MSVLVETDGFGVDIYMEVDGSVVYGFYGCKVLKLLDVLVEIV